MKKLTAIHKQRIGDAHVEHGHNRKGKSSATYRCWCAMLNRCRNPKVPAYPNYGGRGIRVCERWHQFTHFLADMGERPEGLFLDRIDNDGHYEPNNCQWRDRHSQANNKRNNKLHTFNGKTMTQAEWAHHAGISPGTLYARLKYGWSLEKAISAPLRDW